MSDSIEAKLRIIIQNSKDKSELVEKLCGLFPGIKEMSKSNEIILDEITQNNNTYYKDKYGNVLNENAELVGTFGKGEIVLFEKNYTLNADIKEIINS